MLDPSIHIYDAVVIGGSYAGMAAAEAVSGTADDFVVHTTAGRLRGRRLVLATGTTDELPAIPGAAERWSKSLFHCPYCHGYEVPGRRIAVLASGPMSVRQALLLREWGDVTLFTRGVLQPDPDEAAQLAGRNVALEKREVTSLEAAADVVVADGTRLSFDALFVAPTAHANTKLATQLACQVDSNPLGTFIVTNAMQETTVQGVFACGDAARPGGNIALAVGAGTLAGAAAHHSLAFA